MAQGRGGGWQVEQVADDYVDEDAKIICVKVFIRCWSGK